MNGVEVIIIVICAVLVSKILNELFPMISIPLFQIALGFILALFVPSLEFNFDTDIFLLVFIAPLLFDDGFSMDKYALWQMRRPILSLAVGLVFVMTLVLGSFLHLIEPSIPLAVAFTFAAALGPTDAVAVNSLARRISLTARQKNLLMGEWLLNDASGIVAFQFALIFVATGAFSLLSATTTFLLEFVGGIVVGIICMFVRGLLMQYINSIGSEDSVLKVAFELITPFIIYLIADGLHTSGILAVVAAGIYYSLSSTRGKYDSARTTTLSANTWSLIVFLLNGIVCVLLGILFVQSLSSVWTDNAINNWHVIGLVFIITLFMYLVRFVWLLPFKTTQGEDDGSILGGVIGQAADVAISMGDAVVSNVGEVFSSGSTEEEELEAECQECSDGSATCGSKTRKSKRKNKTPEEKAQRKTLRRKQLKSTLLLTLSGAKGVVTFAIMLSLPTTVGMNPFPCRSLVIFLAAGVILLTLLVANFVVPLLSAKPKEQENHAQKMLRLQIQIGKVVSQRLAQQRNDENKEAIDQILLDYDRRAAYFADKSSFSSKKLDAAKRLNEDIISLERQHTFQLIEAGETSPLFSYLYLASLEKAFANLERRSVIRAEIKAFFGWAKHFVRLLKMRHQTRKAGKEVARHYPSKLELFYDFPKARRAQSQKLRRLNETYVVEQLEQRAESIDYFDEDEAQVLTQQLAQFRKRLLLETAPGQLFFQALSPEEQERQTVLDEQIMELTMWALQVERNEIHHLLDQDIIDMDEMRELMEDVSIRQIDLG